MCLIDLAPYKTNFMLWPTDTNTIPKELSDHILHDYVHNNCKISRFSVSCTKQSVHLTYKNKQIYTLSVTQIRSIAGLLQTHVRFDGSNT